MNRRANFIFCVLIASISFAMPRLSAQLVNSDTLVYPLSTAGQSFENYLVSLAWENNPAYKIYASKLNIAQSEVIIAKRAWADDWNITLNLNENNLRSTEIDSLTGVAIGVLNDEGLEEVARDLMNSEQALIANNFPRYNFGLSLNLGSLITRGKEVNIAEQKLFIEEFSRDQDKLDIRSKVYRAYAEYTQAIKLLKIRTKAEQNDKDMLDLMETRYKSGSIPFDDYAQAKTSYNNALEALTVGEEKTALAKLALEQLIVIPLSLAKFHYDETNGQ